MEGFNPEKFLNLLKRNSKFIFTCLMAGLVVGIFYSVVLFKPAYKSSAKLLIKDAEQTTFVSEIGSPNRLGALARNSNPLLTQMQILSSDEFAQKVWKEVSEKNKLKIEENQGIAQIKNAISLSNPVGTDIIEVTAVWSNPEIARDIALAVVSVYQNSNVDIAKRGIVQSRLAIDNKLEEAEKNLQQVRNNIQNFRKNNSTIDLRVESENIISQITTLENRYQEVDSTASAEEMKINAMAKNLGIDWHKAIRSVALGHNPTFMDLQTRLGTLQEEFAGFSARYTPLHPSMIGLIARIENIKEQIQNQIRLTLGSVLEKEEMIISDPVRTGMMEALVTSEAEYTGLKAQAKSIENSLNKLMEQKAEIPRKQLALANYLQQEANWAGIVNTLNAKQVEAEIRESGVTSNINVVDTPSVPVNCTFPGRFQLMTLFAAFSALFASAFIVIREIIKNNYDNAEQIEKDLGVPVLGVIPWLDKELYDEPDVMFAVDESASFYSLAYQKAVSGMRIKGYNSGKRALAFTSSEFSKYRSTIIMNLAYGLSRTGQSVVVVDADFRTPSIGKDIGLEVNNKYSLSELITVIAKDVQQKGTFDRDIINLYAHSIPRVNNFFLIPNTGNVSDPCEFLHSQAFNVLIQELKNKYDWVLVDVPPAQAVPDAMTVGSYVDGMVLVTGLENNRTVLRKIHNRFRNYNVNVFGVIAREVQTQEAVSANEYIKQMISRMMPQNEEMLTE